MKKILVASVMVFMFLALTGCGGGGSSPPPTVLASIISDPAFDGDILEDPVSGVFTVTQGMTPTVQSVFAGISPTTSAESRAFLHFDLAGVPLNAVIVSAFLDIVLDNVQTQLITDTIPIRIDLVSFQQPMIGSDFNRPALATKTINPPISQADFGLHVNINVTTLMVEAQRLGLANFQIRIMQDNQVLAPPGQIEINDTTGVNRTIWAPLLDIEYF